MKQLLSISLFVLNYFIANSQGSQCATSLKEDFESYPIGSLFVSQVRQTGNTCWSTWDCINGSNNPQDVKVLNNSSSGNYLNVYAVSSIGGPDDIVRYLGNKTSGKYEICFDIRVRSGKCALYSVLHEFVCNNPSMSDYAFATRFLNGYVELQIGQNNYYTRLTNYNSNTWFRVKYIIDLDTKNIYFYPNLNYSYYYTWKFDASNRINRNNQLGAINFWSHSNADYDIDNFQLISNGIQSETFSVSPPSIFLNNGCNPSTFCFSITSNTNWRISSPSWLNLSPDSGNGNSTICGTISSNPSTSSRTATVSFTYGVNNNQGTSIVVTQEGCGQPKFCYFDPPSISYKCNGGIQSVSIISNDSWSYSDKPDWMHIKNVDLNGSGSKLIEFTADQNNGALRSGSVIYSCGSANSSLYISQEACSQIISSNPTNISVDCNSQIKSILVTSTTNWVLLDKPTWVNLSPANGFPNSTSVTITISANNDTKSRNGVIRLSYGSPSLIYLIPISQDPCPINNNCYFNPSILNVSDVDSIYTININSNTTWSYNSGETSWLTVNPKSGPPPSQIKIHILANPNNNNRSAIINFNCGTSGSVFSLDINQTGNNCNFSISPNPIEVGSIGVIDTTLTINSSSLWFLSFNDYDTEPGDKLIGGPAVKDRKGNLTIKPNSSFQSRLLKLKFQHCQGGKEYEVIINQKGNTISTTPPWIVNKTALTHTVVVERNLQSDILGSPLSIGDWIGFFYKDDTLSCSGLGQWLGDDLPILIYGDEPLSPIKDGFDKGQEFLIKIRRYSTYKDITSNAKYEDVANGKPWITKDKFTDGGLSGIYFLKADNCVKPQVPFGNSLISSYILPIDLNMLSIFQSLNNSVRTVVDDQGNVTLPWSGVNIIGDWNYKKAYKISASSEFLISDVFCGDKIVPENEIIPLKANEVTFIPYLRDNIKPVDIEFKEEKDKILWMKDEDLNTLMLPQVNLAWGDLKPFKGYILKARSPFNLIYSPNFHNNILEVRNSFKYNYGEFFKTEFKLTSNGTILVVPEEIANKYFKWNDEIAVINRNGQICGSSVYYGGHFVLKMWGDNPLTTEIDGLLEGEYLNFKRFNFQQNTSEEIEFNYLDNNNPVFDANTMFIASDVNKKEFEIINVFPNPASELIYVSGLSSISVIEIYNNLGEKVIAIENKDLENMIKINTKQLESGGFFIKLYSVLKNNVIYKKVLVLK
ncbi:MAG TPA: BACON domain-containing carbohydrate-binding protein [Saprospiraceae bacterium]|nr:BACON domain-containing carbohydrate-binding protein [Saprospiraceae bacterium]